jgi:hypothetical protein
MAQAACTQLLQTCEAVNYPTKGAQMLRGLMKPPHLIVTLCTPAQTEKRNLLT